MSRWVKIGKVFPLDRRVSNNTPAVWNKRRVYIYTVYSAVFFNCVYILDIKRIHTVPDSKVHGANMGLTWVLSARGGPHAGSMNFAIRGGFHTSAWNATRVQDWQTAPSVLRWLPKLYLYQTTGRLSGMDLMSVHWNPRKSITTTGAPFTNID